MLANIRKIKSVYELWAHFINRTCAFCLIQALATVKRTPAYKNRLKALELERTGGVSSKKKGPKQIDQYAVQFILLPFCSLTVSIFGDCYHIHFFFWQETTGRAKQWTRPTNQRSWKTVSLGSSRCSICSPTLHYHQGFMLWIMPTFFSDSRFSFSRSLI